MMSTRYPNDLSLTTAMADAIAFASLVIASGVALVLGAQHAGPDRVHAAPRDSEAAGLATP